MMGLDSNEDMATYAQVSFIQVAWAGIKAFQLADDQDKADKRVLGITTQLKHVGDTVLNKQYETNQEAKVPDAKLPGNTILEDTELE